MGGLAKTTGCMLSDVGRPAGLEQAVTTKSDDSPSFSGLNNIEGMSFGPYTCF